MTEVTKERRAELLALFKEELGIGKPKAKPKVVTSEAEVIRDAVVRVSPDDPNYPNSKDGTVEVRPKDWVKINMEVWEEQQRQKIEDRMRLREIDPFRLGHWD